MVVSGWKLYAHPLFHEQLGRLTEQVEALAKRDPTGYQGHAPTKLLATINRYIRELIHAIQTQRSFGKATRWVQITGIGSAPSFMNAIDRSIAFQQREGDHFDAGIRQPAEHYGGTARAGETTVRLREHEGYFQRSPCFRK